MTLTRVLPLAASAVPRAGSLWMTGALLGVQAVTGQPQMPLFTTFNFAVEIEGLLVGGFTKVSGLDSQIAVEEYQEGGVNGYVHQFPTRTSHSRIVLKHGLTALDSLWNWYHDTTRGTIHRRSGTILLLNPQQYPVTYWTFRNALPVKFTGPTFDATSSEVGVESVELVHEGITKPLLGQLGAWGHSIAQWAD